MVPLPWKEIVRQKLTAGELNIEILRISTIFWANLDIDNINNVSLGFEYQLYFGVYSSNNTSFINNISLGFNIQ